MQIKTAKQHQYTPIAKWLKILTVLMFIEDAEPSSIVDANPKWAAILEDVVTVSYKADAVLSYQILIVLQEDSYWLIWKTISAWKLCANFYGYFICNHPK